MTSHIALHSLDFWVTTKSNNNCKAISSPPPPSSSTLLDFPFILPLVNTTMHDGDDLTWWWFWIPADAYALYTMHIALEYTICPYCSLFPFSLIIRDPFLEKISNSFRHAFLCLQTVNKEGVSIKGWKLERGENENLF